MKGATVRFGHERPKGDGLSLLHGSYPSEAETRKTKANDTGEVYWLQNPVDLYSFDEEYLRRLGARDPAIEAHFFAYFNERLKVTLRARGVDTHTIDDVRQETFCRVWVAVQSGSVHNPKGFGSYVYSVCKNVLSEKRRDDFRNQHDPIDSTDVPNDRLGLEELMQQEQDGRLVQQILAKLPERDRHLLLARFFEEKENDDVCAQFGVNRDYLRVLLHRALEKFGELYKKND
ncbi:MAG TPA: sigma-70 family RNA polymerase sigma factor [Candidatus Angelobacter sp.]|nr:sigma-70 family RNA polymerase sigma factor [Candidatus Angelobacter sp.]